jgi:hypothetical protein
VTRVVDFEVKGTKISIRRLIRSNVRRCAASPTTGGRVWVSEARSPGSFIR